MIRRCLACLLILFAAPVALFAEDKTKDKNEPKMSAEETKLLEIINKQREEHKLPPLKINPVLVKVARAHSDNMARQEKMDHVLDGKNPAQRVRAAGYDYQNIAENIAFSTGKVPLNDVVEQWMNSKHHKDNILNKKLRETGLAIARSKKGVFYYTQVFGTPLPKD